MRSFRIYQMICGVVATCSLLAAPIPAQDEIELPITLREPGWIEAGPGATLQTRRVALLLGVARHAAHRDWDLDYIENDLQVMRAALEDLPGSFEVKTLRNNEVTAEALESYLTAVLPRQLAGSRGYILIFYYSGHGVIQNGQRCYFTHHTDLSTDGSRYNPLITESDLAGWINRLKAGADVKVFLLLDACASSEKAPRGRARDQMLGDACIYATPRNEMAHLAADQSCSAFTREICLALADLSRRPRMTVSDVWKCVRSGMGLSKETEGPQLYPRSADLVLQNRRDLSFTVLAVDGDVDMELEDARVYRGEQKMGAAPFSFTGLAEGSYRVSVDAENYLKRHVEVRLSPKTSGRVFRVPLYPKFMVLEGRVRLEEGTSDAAGLAELDVEVLGSRGSFQLGWHTATSRVDATGSFRLFLPRDAESTGLRLLRGGRRVAALDFDLREMPPFDRVWQGNPLPVYTLEAAAVGTTALTGAAPRTATGANRAIAAGSSASASLSRLDH